MTTRLPVRGPPAIERFRQKSIVGGRLREKSTVGDRLSEKKGRRSGKEEKKKRGEEERIPSTRALSSLMRRRQHPRAIAVRGSRALFLLRVKLAIQHMRKVIKKKANFDIMDLDTIQVNFTEMKSCLVGWRSVGDKNIIKFDGDHNSPRPQFYFDSITIFFHNVLDPPKSVSDELYFHRMHDFFGQVSHSSGYIFVDRYSLWSWFDVCDDSICRIIGITCMNMRIKILLNHLKASLISLMSH
ncbi:hypothetical protein GW17_00003743 [Ensete ventricosum]|nr:hypothetical protein GW17_00003743 [Ensete ventricosum]